ncbi:hypothetical protein [Corynebacterium endometrii]|nr:hypothetical protein [Corynebacterium endometrii]
MSTDIMLAPGEKGLHSVSLRPNLLLFWLKSKFLVTNKRIVVKHPNTLFGIIPLGYEETAMPMGSVAGVQATVAVKTARLVFFGLLFIFCFFAMFDSQYDSDGKFLFFVMSLFFFALAANAILAGLIVTNNGGGKSQVTVSIMDKARLEEFKNKANEYIYSASVGGTSWNDALAQPQPQQNPYFQNGWGQPYSGPTGPESNGNPRNY